MSEPSAVRKTTGRDRWIAATLGLAYFIILLATSHQIGFVRDEGYYFRAAERYSGWFDLLVRHPGAAFGDEAITHAYSFNYEHPVLLKNAFALSLKLLHVKLGWVAGSTACRIPAMALAGLLIFLTYLFGVQLHGRRVGLFAALSLATLPRLFHDAHLACFDVGMATLELAVIYCWWRSLDSRRWAITTGLVLGLALATKHNAIFIPVILGGHALARGRMFAGGGGRGLGRIPPIPFAFASMALLAPLVFFVHWPWLWHHTAERLAFYVKFHLHHVHYPVEYFGAVLDRPPFPWSYSFVLTALTVPACVLLLMTLGLIRGTVLELRRSAGKPAAQDDEAGDGRRSRLLLLLAAIYPLFVISLPGVPIFGGVKHWYTAMPALALLAGVELARLVDRVGRRAPGAPASRRQLAAWSLAAALVLVPSVLGIRLVHPYGIGFYNELAGGIRGAADLGMLRNFWGYTSRGNLAYLNQNVEPNGTVFFQHTNFECYTVDRAEGLVRSDIEDVPDLGHATWALYEIQRAFADEEYRIWNDWNTAQPVTGVYVDEVPMNLVYRRPSE